MRSIFASALRLVTPEAILRVSPVPVLPYTVAPLLLTVKVSLPVARKTLALVVPADCLLALHVTVVPPLLPAHFQLQGPVPVNSIAAPVLQKFAVGAMLNVPLLLVPHVPLAGVWLKVAEIVCLAVTLVIL